MNSIDYKMTQTVEPAKKLEIILCVEGGYFEKQAKLLIHNIRNLGGDYKDVPIFCYQPRKAFPIDSATKKFFESYNVVFNDQDLNKTYKYFKFTNKSVICAYHELHSSADVIAYLDCDTIVLNDVSPFARLNHGEVVVRPEDSSRMVGCSSKFEGSSGHIWKKIYEHLNIQNIELVHSIEDYQPMLAYYNAGQIISHRSNYFFSRWNENFLKCLKDRVFNNELLIMSDQMLMSATVSQMNLEIRQLGVGFNFPVNLFLFDDIKHPEYQQVDFNQLITLHYHKILLRGYNSMEYLLRQSPNGKLVNEGIKLYDLLKADKGLILSKLRHKYYDFIAHNRYCH